MPKLNNSKTRLQPEPLFEFPMKQSNCKEMVDWMNIQGDGGKKYGSYSAIGAPFCCDVVWSFLFGAEG